MLLNQRVCFVRPQTEKKKKSKLISINQDPLEREKQLLLERAPPPHIPPAQIIFIGLTRKKKKMKQREKSAQTGREKK